MRKGSGNGRFDARMKNHLWSVCLSGKYATRTYQSTEKIGRHEQNKGPALKFSLIHIEFDLITPKTITEIQKRCENGLYVINY